MKAVVQRSAPRSLFEAVDGVLAEINLADPRLDCFPTVRQTLGDVERSADRWREGHSAAERSLREKLAFMQAVFETVINTSPSPIIMIDREGCTTEINQAAQSTLGIDRTSLKNQCLHVVDVVWNGNEALAQEANWAMVVAAVGRRSHQPHYTTFYRRCPSSGRRLPVPVRMFGAPLHQPGRRGLIGSIGIFEDLCAGQWCDDMLILQTSTSIALTIDPILATVFETVRNAVNPGSLPLVLVSEPGNGKELLVEALHELSARRGPLVTVNCSTEPDPRRLEAFLFGEDSSGVGDVHGRQGVFEIADHGTVFLNEIDELPMPAQIRLERLLTRGVVQRVGSSIDRMVRVQLAAGPTADLDDVVKIGRFRPELRRLLKGSECRIPPLRERRADVLLLAEHFLGPIRQDAGGEPSGFSSDATRTLLAYPWPGNVGELKMVVQRAAFACLTDTPSSQKHILIRSRHLPRQLVEAAAEGPKPLITEGEYPRPAALTSIARRLLEDSDLRRRLCSQDSTERLGAADEVAMILARVSGRSM